MTNVDRDMVKEEDKKSGKKRANLNELIKKLITKMMKRQQ